MPGSRTFRYLKQGCQIAKDSALKHLYKIAKDSAIKKTVIRERERFRPQSKNNNVRNRKISLIFFKEAVSKKLSEFYVVTLESNKSK